MQAIFYSRLQKINKVFSVRVIMIYAVTLIKISEFEDAVVWRKNYENPVMTFPIKNRINTELFIDRTAAPFQLKVGSRIWWGGSTTSTNAGLSKDRLYRLLKMI